MADFSLLIKPVGAACNLACRYCYYCGERDAPRSAPERTAPMSDAVLERTISGYMSTEQSVHSMIWHGGEPTLLPASFYRRAIELQKRHARPGSRLSNSLQTNGLEISPEQAALFARYRFLCGVSLDGTSAMHDRFRRTRSDEPSHRRVRTGLRTLDEAGVATSTLAVVSRANVRHPVAAYRALRKAGATHLHFIPCVEWDADGALRPEAIDGEAWGRFLIGVFNEWRRQNIGAVSVRLFESILAKLVHETSLDCAMSDRCDRYLVVEANGDIFPCDFYVDPAYRLGNVMDTSFEAVRESTRYREFAERKTHWAAPCGGCEFRHLCMGDCRKFRTRSDRPSHLCEGWKAFYSHSLPIFTELAARIRG